MLANGYVPIPLDGKKPMLNNWQNTLASKDILEKWANIGPNTGMLTRHTPVLDIDILDEVAAQMVEAIARQCLEDVGQVIIRIGLPPKRAILLRTDKPFKKIIRKLTAPDGTSHKIEVLGDGQQLAGWPETTPTRDNPMSGGVAGLRSTPRTIFCRRRMMWRPYLTCASMS